MGYIFALVLLVIVVPLVFLLLTRRPAGGGRAGRADRGYTVEEPSSDQPSPGGTVNQPTPEAERRLPPG